MPSGEERGVARNDHDSGLGNNLKSSQTTKGFQNTRRSFRGVGAGGSNHERKRPSLGDCLAKVDTKQRGNGSTGRGKNAKPQILDDVSIDDSVWTSDDSGPNGSTSQRRKIGETPQPALRKAPVRRAMTDLSQSEHVVPTEGRRSRMDELLTRSEHGRPTPRRPQRCSTFNGKSSGLADGKLNAVQAIYKLLDSMEKKEANTDICSPKGGAPQPRARRLRKSKSVDTTELGQPICRDFIGRKTIQGVRTNRDQSPTDTSDQGQSLSLKEKSFLTAENSNDSEKITAAATKGEDNGTSTAAIQGIQALLGSMNKNAPSKTEKTDTHVGGELQNSRSTHTRSSLRLHGHAENFGPISAGIKKGDDAPSAKQLSDTKNETTRREKVNETKLHSSNPSEEGDAGDDYATVVTMKTTEAPTLQPMKDAPPPPQRKVVARKPQNCLSKADHEKWKACGGSYRSAPGKILPTAMMSDSVIVADLQTKHISLPVAGDNMPQYLTTPHAVTLPVVHRNDGDGLATPTSMANVAPLPVFNAPPPPPRRNNDMGSRRKNRPNKLSASGDVCVTPSAPKAPAMSILSPGGIVIVVDSMKSGMKYPSQPPEPITPIAEMTPEASLSGGRKTLRHSFASQGRNFIPTSQSLQSQKNPATPFMQSYSSDISELTPGTLGGSQYGWTSRERETPLKTVPRTTNLCFSPAIFSEDDDYRGKPA